MWGWKEGKDSREEWVGWGRNPLPRERTHAGEPKSKDIHHIVLFLIIVHSEYDRERAIELLLHLTSHGKPPQTWTHRSGHTDLDTRRPRHTPTLTHTHTHTHTPG